MAVDDLLKSSLRGWGLLIALYRNYRLGCGFFSGGRTVDLSVVGGDVEVCFAERLELLVLVRVASPPTNEGPFAAVDGGPCACVER